MIFFSIRETSSCASAENVARKAKASSPAKRAPASREEALFTRLLDIVEASRGHAARSVNSAIGREIVVAEQAARSGPGTATR